MTEWAAIVGAQPFLRRLPAGQVERLAACARHVILPAGTRLFEEGAPAHSFWLIDAGQVAIDTLVPGEGRVTIEKLGRGDLLGLSWLAPPWQFKYGAVATQPLQAFEFDATAVRAACDADPALGYVLVDRLLAVAARRLQATRARLIDAHLHPKSALSCLRVNRCQLPDQVNAHADRAGRRSSAGRPTPATAGLDRDAGSPQAAAA